jgi:hypothetical protein
MTYYYRLADPLFKIHKNKTLYYLDKNVVGDPHKYFDGEAIKWWGHMNDDTGIIDIDTSLGIDNTKDNDIIDSIENKEETEK